MSAWEVGVNLMVAQGGLARRDTLLGLGVTPQTLRRRVLAGLLVPVNRQVVALPATQLDLAVLTRAAVMARPDSIPTGLSAAALHGPSPWDEVPLVGDPWLVGRPDRSLRARFVTHIGIGTVKRSGLVVADPASTVIDLLRFLSAPDAARVGRAALQRRVVTLDLLVAAHARLAGLRGVGQLAVVIAELVEGTHSEAEHELVFVVRQAGLIGWRANHPVRVGGRQYFLDLAFPESRLAIEVDGRAHHSDPRSFRRDRQRQNDLVAAGWTVLRFTWDDLVADPAGVIGRIVEALARAAAS
jgi:very-short-patch-repair endonuclease